MHRPIRYRRPGEPFAEIIVGSAVLWGQPNSGHLTLDMNFIDVGMLVPSRKGWMLGSSMQLVSMRSDRWLGHLQKGDFWLNTRKWGRLGFFMGGGLFRIKAGFWIYRQAEWGLPEAQKKALYQQVQASDKNKDKDLEGDLAVAAPSLFLPTLRAGLYSGPFSLEVGGELLSWDARSYRGDIALTLQGHGVKLMLATSYIENAARLEAYDTALATWHQRSVEASAKVQVDIMHFFMRNMRHLWGPVMLSMGVRYRNNFFNQLDDMQGKPIFHEQTGSEWTISGGLVIGFSSRQRGLFD